MNGMEESKQVKASKDPSFIPLMRGLALELLIYTPLVTLYFLLFLHFAKDTLTMLFEESPTIYAVVATLAIVGQGVLLEMITSWLLRKVGLRQ
jgi:hypothetical protein